SVSVIPILRRAKHIDRCRVAFKDLNLVTDKGRYTFARFSCSNKRQSPSNPIVSFKTFPSGRFSEKFLKIIVIGLPFLGLYIARNFMRSMNGDLTYRQEDGKLEFLITLPLA
ncbi:MAG: hypothetical protein SOT08_01560, partial [Candidatus Borkfalkiaceae bacterium]|nr:hypothetical protein [Christensenellaceae bacterium]